MIGKGRTSCGLSVEEIRVARNTTRAKGTVERDEKEGIALGKDYEARFLD